MSQTRPQLASRQRVGTALADGISQLKTDNPRLAAELLLAHTMGVSRSWLSAHPNATLEPGQPQRFAAYIDQVRRGVPLPYVLGRWEFYGLDLCVDQRALIPRPETELLVDTALNWARDRQQVHIVEVGTGSGCIAIALAVRLPAARLVAVDLSAAALDLARTNARRHGVDQRIQFVHGDLLAGIGPADLICANPPYVASQELSTLSVAQYEPRLALDGGSDGLHSIRRLLHAAERCLLPNGLLLVEIGATQGAAARELAHRTFPNAAIEIRQDFAWLDRLLMVHR